VVQRASGVRVQQHITDRFLAPLGMSNTTWVEPSHADWARPFRVQDGVAIPDPHHPIGDGEIAPMGGLWTTVRDLARWITFLNAANGPSASHSEVLSAPSRREMQMVHTHIGRSTLGGRSGTAGYGFGVRTFDDDEFGMNLAHSGGVPGYGTNMRWLHHGRFTTNVGAIALANTTYAPVAHLTMQMLASVAPHLTRRTVDTALLGERGAQLVALIDDWSDSTAAALFADNVALDDTLARRATAAREIRTLHGSLRIVDVHADTLTRGTVTVQGDGPTFTIDLQLAPLAGAPVQWYEVNRPA
jgi:CubicO group peptidase (beta-lactamase class C family)